MTLQLHTTANVQHKILHCTIGSGKNFECCRQQWKDTDLTKAIEYLGRNKKVRAPNSSQWADESAKRRQSYAPERGLLRTESNGQEASQQLGRDVAVGKSTQHHPLDVVWPVKLSCLVKQNFEPRHREKNRNQVLVKVCCVWEQNKLQKSEASSVLLETFVDERWSGLDWTRDLVVRWFRVPPWISVCWPLSVWNPRVTSWFARATWPKNVHHFQLYIFWGEYHGMTGSPRLAIWSTSTGLPKTQNWELDSWHQTKMGRRAKTNRDPLLPSSKFQKLIQTGGLPRIPNLRILR